MKTFKEFLLTEDAEYTLFKPQTARFAYGWGSRNDWIDVFTIPTMKSNLIKSMEESGSVRMIITKDGQVFAWSGGILHNIFLSQVKNINPMLNLIYDDKDANIYADQTDTSESPTDRIVKYIEANMDSIFKKTFSDIKMNFPYAKFIIFEKYKLSLDEPYAITKES